MGPYCTVCELSRLQISVAAWHLLKYISMEVKELLKASIADILIMVVSRQLFPTDAVNGCQSSSYYHNLTPGQIIAQDLLLPPL